MLNDEFTELLKDAKEVEKKTPKGKQNTHSSSLIHEYFLIDFRRDIYMSLLFDM